MNWTRGQAINNLQIIIESLDIADDMWGGWNILEAKNALEKEINEIRNPEIDEMSLGKDGL